LLPGSAATAARLEVLRGGKDGLLSVREAAEQLGLCTATVYGLCAKGRAAAHPDSECDRIAPPDLAAFVAARRVSSTPGE